jgi:hypothetical protein
MDARSCKFIQDLQKIMDNYGMLGCVATFYDHPQDEFKTLCITSPFVNKKPFADIEADLKKAVDTHIDGVQTHAEEGFITRKSE